jgi:predicted amidohydrolase YtcJ
MTTEASAPDMILYNGNIYTMDEKDSIARSIAVKDGRIMSLSNDSEIESIAGESTHRIDLKGRAVIPGIFDSHIHLMQVGAKLSAVRLDECRNIDEMVELAVKRAQDTPPGQWIIGQGWNEANFPDGRIPSRLDIDPALSDHPVVLKRFFNMYLVNSRGLELAGIDENTRNPHGGIIEKGPDGKPTGIIRANAKALIDRLLPVPDLDQMKGYIHNGFAEIHRYGITSIMEPGLLAEEIRAYQSLYDRGGLSVRATLMPNWHGFRDEGDGSIFDHRPKALGITSGFGHQWLRIGSLKMMLDGGTSPHTAFMYEPYEGEKEVSAFSRIAPETLHRYCLDAQESGWDMAIHCCGDTALDLAVNTLSKVSSKIQRPDARHSIIHAYFPSDRALDQMAKHNIAAVLQPTFIYWEGDLIFRDVGEKRTLNYKPARKYLDRGIRIAASSDEPATVSANPFKGLYALVTRKNNLNHLIAPDQAVTRKEALHAYTTGGAWLTREEHLKGTLEIGKLADMAILDRDYFQIPEEEIKDIQVEMTILNGKPVYTS